MSDVADALAVLQFGDSFFPSGAVSFSWGMEGLSDSGVVTDADGVRAFVIGQLRAREGAEPVFEELLRVTQMRRFLAFCERQLADQRARAGRKQPARTGEATTTPSRVFRREDRWRLYDAVWSKPVAKAARRLGVSAIGLKEACSQLEIPTPPRGYWVKKKAGQPVARRPRLRELTGGLPRG